MMERLFGVLGVFRVLGFILFYFILCFPTNFPQFSCFFLHGVLVFLALGLMDGREKFFFFSFFFFFLLLLTHTPNFQGGLLMWI